MNIFSRISKSLFQPQQTSAVKFVTVESAVNYDKIPMGFFNVETARGRKTLGFRDANLTSFDCRSPVWTGSKTETLSVPRETLPTVKLNFPDNRLDGVQTIKGRNLMDISSFDTFDGEVKYESMR
jgi:hypothetical protein